MTTIITNHEDLLRLLEMLREQATKTATIVANIGEHVGVAADKAKFAAYVAADTAEAAESTTHHVELLQNTNLGQVAEAIADAADAADIAEFRAKSNVTFTAEADHATESANSFVRVGNEAAIHMVQIVDDLARAVDDLARALENAG